MSRIFLSHSSADNAAAIAVRDWLASGGWDDVFLDLDAGGIAAGERWERRLYEAANRCEAVVFLISRSWLASEWCLREYDLAVRLNKRIFGVLIDATAITDLPTRISGTWQLVNLAQGEDHRPFRAVLPSGVESHLTFSTGGLRRLKAGLEKAGLDPRFFAWPPSHDPERAPYRGLLPLETEDAGIFFGREASIIAALDQLRGLSDAAPPRFLAILGASGAGKSSFLRAGLLPRLARDDRRFLVLPVVRPDRKVLSGEAGLLRSLEGAFRSQKRPRTRTDLRTTLERSVSEVSKVLAELVDGEPIAVDDVVSASTRPEGPTIILPIDQGEELFIADQDEARRFLPMLREMLLRADLRLLVIVTIRSDAFERLQFEPLLADTQPTPFNLPPLPRGAYQAVIEGPAHRLKDSDRPLVVEPALTAALLKEIEEGGAKDALPLLAFTLERLYVEHGGDGDLRLSEFRQLGGIKGSIEAAVAKAFSEMDADPSIPRSRTAREALLRRALIPWLAGIDPDTGAPRRRVAKLSEIPEEARALVRHLIAQRLLSSDVSLAGDPTLEPAHEVLLRKWGLLQGWLEEDAAAILTLDGVKRAAGEWESNRRDAAWLAHRAGRLEDAERFAGLPQFTGFLSGDERIYLQSARAADTRRRDRDLEEARQLADAQRQAAERQKEVTRRTLIGAICAMVLAVLAVGAGLYAANRAALALEKTKIAQEQAAIAEAATRRADDAAQESAKQAMEAERQREEAEKQGLLAEEQAGIARKEKADAEVAKDLAQAETARAEAEVQRALLANARTLAGLADKANGANDYGTGLALALEGLPGENRPVPYAVEAERALWDSIRHLRERAAFLDHEWTVPMAVFSEDQTRVLTASWDWRARLWETKTGKLIRTFGQDGAINWAGFLPGEKAIITSSSDATARIFDVDTGKLLHTFGRHASELSAVAWNSDASMVATSDGEKMAILWDARSGRKIADLPINHSVPTVLLFSRDGRRLVMARPGEAKQAAEGKPAVPADRQIRFVDLDNPKSIASVVELQADILSVSSSPEGDVMAARGQDGVVWLYAISTGALLKTIDAGPGNGAFSLSTDGNRMWSLSADRVSIWNVRTGRRLETLDAMTSPLRRLDFNADATKLIMSLEDGSIVVRELEWAVPPLTFPTGLHWASNLDLSRDEKELATTHGDFMDRRDTTARVWSLGLPAGTVSVKNPGTTMSVRAISGNGNWAAVSVTQALPDAGPRRLLNTSDGSEVALLAKGGIDTKFLSTPDGRLLLRDVPGSSRSAFDVLDGETGETKFRVAVDLQDGRFSATYEGPTISPDGDWIAIPCSISKGERTGGSHFEVFSLRDGSRQTSMEAPTDVVRALFLKGGDSIATISGANVLRLFETNSGRELTPPDGIPAGFSVLEAMSLSAQKGIVVTGDGKLAVATVGDDRSISFKPLESAEDVYNPQVADADRVFATANQVLVSWNAATGEKTWSAPDQRALQYRVTPDGRSVVLLTDVGLLRLDAGTGKELWRFPVPHIGSGDYMLPAVSNQAAVVVADGRTMIISFSGAPVSLDVGLVDWSSKVVFTDDGRLLITSDAETLLIDVATGRTIRRFGKREKPALDPLLMAGGQTIAVSDGTSLPAKEFTPHITVFDTRTGDTLANIPSPQGVAPWGDSLAAFSPDDDKLVTVWPDGSSSVVKTSDWLVESVSIFGDKSSEKEPSMRYSNLKALSSNGAFFAFVDDGAITVVERQTGKARVRLPEPDYDSAIAFSPDEAFLVIASEKKGEIAVADLKTAHVMSKTLALTPTFSGRRNWAFAGDNIAVLVKQKDGDQPEENSVRIIRLSDGMELRSIPLASGAEDMQVSPDGHLLATLDYLKLIVWDLATAKPTFEVPAPFRSEVIDFTFSRETESNLGFAGRDRLFVWGDRGETFVYDIARGILAARYLALPGADDKRATPTGSRLLGILPHGRFATYPVPLNVEESVALGCSIMPRSLSDDQRREFGLDAAPRQMPCGRPAWRKTTFDRERYLRER